MQYNAKIKAGNFRFAVHSTHTNSRCILWEQERISLKVVYDIIKMKASFFGLSFTMLSIILLTFYETWIPEWLLNKTENYDLGTIRRSKHPIFSKDDEKNWIREKAIPPKYRLKWVIKSATLEKFFGCMKWARF